MIKIELTAKIRQNRGFLLVESSKSRPLIGREDPQKKSKGLTLIQKCPSFLCHSFILPSFHKEIQLLIPNSHSLLRSSFLILLYCFPFVSTNSLKSDFSRMAGVRISQSDNNRAFVHLHKNPFALVCPVWNHLTSSLHCGIFVRYLNTIIIRGAL